MSRRGFSPKELHREGATRVHVDGYGDIHCILHGARDEQGRVHECGGRLQCHHPIEAQRIRTLWDRADYRFRMNIKPFGPLAGVSLATLIADPRNSCFVCEVGHRQLEKRRYKLPRLPLVEAFASDYGIEHEVPAWQEPAPTNNERSHQ